MKTFYSFIVCMLFFSTPGIAQILKGHIYDATTSEPLAGATVSYKLDGNQGVTSDANGAYEIKVPSGGVDLVVSYIGYEDVLIPIVIEKREIMTKDVYMKQSTELLQEVVVSAGRFEQKLSDVTVSMDLLKATDIARQAPTDITSTLQTLSGIDIVDKQPSIRGGGGWTYSVGARSQILVDGMSTLSPQTGAINWNTIPLENVEQVEVIKGASSVLYGSSALNGIINVRTARPGIAPRTRLSAYVGIYGDPANEEYRWSDKNFWKEGKYAVKPLLRNSLFSGVRNPIYEGFDFSHSRRIGNFDVSGGLNLFTDEGYRQQSYNKRFRVGGSLTYHQPDMDGKVLNYGFNADFLSNKYGDFFIWRSPAEPLRPSPFTNMGREENNFHIDPFINYTDPDRGITHKIKGRFYYSGDNIVRPTEEASILDILGNMGTDVQAIQNIAGGDMSILLPFIQPALQGDLNGAINGLFTSLGTIFPNATTSDYCDLISWTMNHGLPKDFTSILNGKLPSDLAPWLSGVLNPSNKAPTLIDKNYDYFLDYQFGKHFDGGAQITTGLTYEHIRNYSAVMDETHHSDNVAAYFQYDQRFFDRLSVSAGVRTEYYRVDNHYREADTKVFGTKIPIRPVFRAGLNYQLADYSFLRASFGQGYRNPSIVEKFLRKDIGGVGVYPNLDIKPEKGFNAEVGFKQGYGFGNFRGTFDMAGFYTQYKNMIEFQFGLFDNSNNKMINSIGDALHMLGAGQGFGIGAQFHNVSEARIYGLEIGTAGEYSFNKHTKLLYNVGYVYLEPRDADYKERKAIEDSYTDPLQMKEKSNDSPYLKYRQKHTVKGTFDFQWKRVNLGVNLAWKSKMKAVDYIMLDEREKPLGQADIMDYVRNILFGNIEGENLASYWKAHNTDYFTMDMRFGVKVTKEVAFQFMVNNLLNKEYSYRPMALGAPRTFAVKLDVTF
ncbi:TonB-dependent receptor [Parabacteroides pacaensis]|uniref:TonB-dependent receptor n=1 Tax=Parabacteroides pacaensis TaxID=2086575 RepID=UPI000D104105|nr:TonB-dependent receptor [Parabacteroides pacaensis]